MKINLRHSGKWVFVFSIVVTLLSLQKSFAQATFQHTFGGTKDDGYTNGTEQEAARQTSDGGYIMAGTSWILNGSSEDGYLVKMDAAGYPVWTKTYGGSWNDYIRDVKQTIDGGYILTGYTFGFGATQNNGQVWLVKTNSSGTQSWSKTYGGTGLSYGRQVQQTADGGFIIVGETSNFGAGNRDVYLIKTNASGTLLWTKTYGTSSTNDYGYSVVQTNDGGYAITGKTGATTDMFLIKTDAAGAQQWSATYGTTSTDAAYFVKTNQ